MKTLVKLLTVAIIVLTFTVFTSKEANSQHVSVSFQVFYDQLSPYGTWVDYPDYGYVWVPDAGPGFYPYASDGHWVFTQYGWTWVSDYPWGWAPFHYGRWYYDPYYGNVWIPDTEWGPAWVTWRRSEGYYGWAPLGPNISLSVAFGPSYNIPSDRWIFVRDRDLTRRDIPRYYVDRSTNVTIINNSTVIQNTYVDNSRNATYITGPDKSEIQKVTGQTIEPVAVRDSDTPKQELKDNQLQIYRPQVKKVDNQGQKPAPAKVAKKEDVKPAAERSQGKANTKEAPANQLKERQPAQKTNQPEGQKQAQPDQKMNKPEGQKQAQPDQKMNKPGGQKQAQPDQKMNKPEGQKQAQPDQKMNKPEGQKQTQPDQKMNKPEGQKQAQPDQKMNQPEGQKQAQPDQKMNQPEGQKQAQPDQKMNKTESQVKGQPAQQVTTPKSEKQKQTTVTRTQKKQKRAPATTTKKKVTPEEETKPK